MSTEKIEKISIFIEIFILVIWHPIKITSGGPWPLPGPYATTPLALSPISTFNTGIEDNEHFFLHCPLLQKMRNDLFHRLSEIPGVELDTFSSESICELLLFGNSQFNDIPITLILEATILFIIATKRFD